MTISLSMIVKASDDEAKLLNRCLKYAAPYVDEVNLTITGENEACEKVAKKYKAKVSHFKWINDFAAARNFNFAQATGNYILWLDCDDVLKGGELLREAVEKMEEKKVDALVLPYLYDFDKYGNCTVRHLKTRIVKNDNCVKWVGILHEDFEKTREITQYSDEDIQVLHLKNEERAVQSSERNLEISKKAFKTDPKDPRNHYLMATSYVGMNDRKNALKYLKSFIELSHSDEEKYLAYIYMADYSEGEEKEHALTKAWTLRPAYPNVYFKLGEYFYNQKRYQVAKNFIELGLQMPKPDDTIIVYNPREYDYVPLMLMVNICFELGEYTKALVTLEVVEKIYPTDETVQSLKKVVKNELGDILKVDEILEELVKIKDKKYLEKRLNKLSDKLKRHPKIALFRNQNFIKETSTGKDLVYYCGFTTKEWSPKATAVGGSEEAVINLTRELAKLGWNITVYNNCGKDAGEYKGVTYRPYWEYNHRDKWDVTILWRSPRTVDHLDERAGKVFVDMHDVVLPGEFTEARLNKISGIFVKSQAHKKILELKEAIVVPNGINVSQFQEAVEKNPCFILNTSSPDRHLDATLDVFEELIKRQPEKPWKLAWYYGWGVYDDVHKNNPEMMAWKKRQMERFEKLVKEGRAEGGYMLTHEEVAKKYLEAGIFLYPTQFYEIDCISARKAQAAGCLVICSDFAALDETVINGLKVCTKGEKWGKENTFGDTQNVSRYVDAVLGGKLLKAGQKYVTNVSGYNQFDWKEISKTWNENLCKK